MTRNAVLQSLRKRHPDARGGSTACAQVAALPDAWSEESLGDDPPSSSGDTAALLNRAMRQIQSRVETTTWLAFHRTVVEGQSTDEVARALDLTPAAVRKAKSRTLQRLRKHLGDQI